MKNHILPLLLAALLCAAALPSCGEDTTDESVHSSNIEQGGNEDTSSVETTDPTRVPPAFTDTFDGQEYVILNGYYNEGKYVSTDIYPEETTGDALNDAMYLRCVNTEEKLDCTITVNEGTLSQIKSNIAAGDDFAHMTFVDLTNIMSLVVQNYCIDLYDMPAIDLTKAWWDHNAEDKLSFDGHLFYTFNDTIFTQMDNARAVYFNKGLAEDLQLGDLYALVKDGGWTIDEMQRMGTLAVSDLNGDGKTTVADDRVGTIMWGVVGIGELLLTGCESEIMMQGDDGIPYFYCFTERFTDVYEKVFQFIKTDDNYKDGTVEQFMSEHSLFFGGTLASTAAMREMDTDFGILPSPKYTADQESYWNVSPNAHALLVPVTVGDQTFAGTVMEEMAYYSNIELLPAYFDTMLKGKSARDEESAAMLDLIHDSISYVIKIVGTKFSDALYNEMKKGNESISSFLASNKTAQETALQEVLDSFNEMNP